MTVERAERSVVGKSFPRLDAVAKATGSAAYTADLKLPRMLHGKILRSPLPHARILNVDLEGARRLPGVKAVVCGRDTLGVKYGILSTRPHTLDEEGLAVEKVRYVGDEVAAVAAVDKETAQRAVDLIRVDYEEIPAVFDPFEAMKEGAPRIHDVDRNVGMEVNWAVGDVEAGFAQSDHVREDTFTTQAQAHATIETHAALASYEPSGKLTLWSTTQSPYVLTKNLARTLGLREGDVRVIKPHLGGGFGAKHQMLSLDFTAAFLSMRTGRPVKIVYGRDEEFCTTLQRHPMNLTLKTGVKRDGALVAKACVNVADSGAYNSHGVLIIGRAGAQLSLVYRVPNFRYQGYLVYTNQPMGGAFRGFGNLQARFADESQMDLLAADLGIDPVEIRLRNARKPDEVTPHGWKVTSCGLSECIREAADRIGWEEKRGKLPLGRGVGLGTGAYYSGSRYVHDTSGAYVRLREDGSISLITGAPDIGQGSDTALAQIAAEEIGVRLEDVHVTSADSELAPVDEGAFASRVTFVAGNAVKLAAADARRQLVEKAADLLEVHPEDLRVRDGEVHVAGNPELGMTVAEAVTAIMKADGGGNILGRGNYVPDVEKLHPETGAGNISGAYSFGAQAAEVEVNPRTGRVNVLRMTAAIDCGRPLNPMAVEGQMEGSIAMGLGWALSEDFVRVEGRTLNASFLDYHIPRVENVPPMDVIIVETEDPLGPFGAKGMSEGSMLPTAPAVVNAVEDAIGVRITDLPATPEKILRALEAQRRKRRSGS
ncbi:MAG: molybdopterin-dependent oxidoreductase [Nitrospinota bacterium]|nr:molybdopterin-dependent oxidoreductase [Nitrospinota bacterium]